MPAMPRTNTAPTHSRGVRRNRTDESKRRLYPAVGSRLLVEEEVLRERCVAMVNAFAAKKARKAADDGRLLASCRFMLALLLASRHPASGIRRAARFT